MSRFQNRRCFWQSMTHVDTAEESFLSRFWDAPDSLVAQGRRLINKNCVRTTVKLDSEFETYVVKRHIERSWRHAAKQSLLRSRAQQCWQDTWRLCDHGYPTPRPVAYLEKRLGPLRGDSFYAYQFVAGQTLKEKASGSANQRINRQYIVQLAEIWRYHVRLRINLNDGHPANFVIDPAGKMWVIDLDKLRRIPADIDPLPQLRATFEKTLRGVFYDPGIIAFARRTFLQIVAKRPRIAA